MSKTKGFNVYIIDDEQPCIDKLSADISTFGCFNVNGSCNSLNHIDTNELYNNTDLLFLDVEMPDGNGLDFLRETAPHLSHMQIVLYSAFDKYTIDALRLSAFDFLLKPYTIEELKTVLDRFMLKRNSHTAPSIHYSLSQLMSKDKRIALRTVTSLLLLKPDDIFAFIYDNDSGRWTVLLRDKSSHRLVESVTTKTVLGLSNLFVPINKQMIANISFVVSIENKTLNCCFMPPYNDMDVKASRRCVQKIRDAIDTI